MRKITVRLTEEEYAALKERAEREHRTLSQQAAHEISGRANISWTRPQGAVWSIGSGTGWVLSDQRAVVADAVGA